MVGLDSSPHPTKGIACISQPVSSVRSLSFDMAKPTGTRSIGFKGAWIAR